MLPFLRYKNTMCGRPIRNDPRQWKPPYLVYLSQWLMLFCFVEWFLFCYLSFISCCCAFSYVNFNFQFSILFLCFPICCVLRGIVFSWFAMVVSDLLYCFFFLVLTCFPIIFFLFAVVFFNKLICTFKFCLHKGTWRRNYLFKSMHTVLIAPHV